TSGHEVLSEFMRKAGHDALAFTARAKRGEGPLELPIYGIEEINEKEKKRAAAALLQTETYDFRPQTNGLITSTVRYSPKPQLDRSLLICGDNAEVMQRLYDEHGSFIDLIYIDP